MKFQRGFAITTILYGIAALIAFGVGAGIVHTYNSAIRESADLKRDLDACKQKTSSLLAQISRQDLAIEEFRKDRDTAQAITQAALKAADASAKGRAAERARAEDLAKNFKATGPCPADQAVKKVQEGLK